jgi:hypothetical protein
LLTRPASKSFFKTFFYTLFLCFYEVFSTILTTSPAGLHQQAPQAPSSCCIEASSGHFRAIPAQKLQLSPPWPAAIISDRCGDAKIDVSGRRRLTDPPWGDNCDPYPAAAPSDGMEAAPTGAGCRTRGAGCPTCHSTGAQCHCRYLRRTAEVTAVLAVAGVLLSLKKRVPTFYLKYRYRYYDSTGRVRVLCSGGSRQAPLARGRGGVVLQHAWLGGHVPASRFLLAAPCS